MIRVKRYILILLFITSCDLQGLVKMKDEITRTEAEQQPVARAHEVFLYPSDLEGIVQPGIPPADSAALVERYVRNWIRKQLLISEAATKMNFDEAEIERKILDYRFSLMGYQYQSYYVDQNLNKEITQQDIAEYYQENQENFELKQNIIQGLYVKVSKEAPQVRQVSRWINSGKPEDRDELKSYCLRFASAYSLEDSLWINFDELTKGTPIENVSNRVQFLRNSKYEELSDDDFYYFIKINDYKIRDQISPMEFVADQIRNILINKRKIELAKELEEEVYANAVENNDFEIYSD